MLIGIDGNEANVQNKVGVNKYAFELLWHIYKTQNVWKDEFRFEIFLKNKQNGLPPESVYWKYRILPGRGMWIIKTLMPNLFFGKNRPDIFFTPSHYIPPLAPMPRICSIMDLGYLKFSEQFTRFDYWQLRLWSAWSIIVSKYIISISETTKKDIVRHYKFASKKIAVTPLGHDNTALINKSNLKNVRRTLSKYKIQNKYLLFISTLKPSKNIEGLLVAWSKVEKDFPDTDLVIAGRKGWLYDPIFKKAKKLGITKRVIFTDFIPDKDKYTLISLAYGFILPSFWEGFGIDVVNAMAAGTPVIVSDRGSLPEVSGKASLVIDPYDTDDIADKIRTLLTMPKKKYNKLVIKGKSQANKFKWENTAAKTLEIFRKLK